MAKVKNIGRAVRGFYDEQGEHVTVQPGEEKEFNMTEADFNKLKELLENEEETPFELSGSHGGVKKLSAKEQKEADAKKAEAESKKAAASKEK
jgi:hypothetical protein